LPEFEVKIKRKSAEEAKAEHVLLVIFQSKYILTPETSSLKAILVG